MKRCIIEVTVKKGWQIPSQYSNIIFILLITLFYTKLKNLSAQNVSTFPNSDTNY